MWAMGKEEMTAEKPGMCTEERRWCGRRGAAGPSRVPYSFGQLQPPKDTFLLWCVLGYGTVSVNHVSPVTIVHCLWSSKLDTHRELWSHVATKESLAPRLSEGRVLSCLRPTGCYDKRLKTAFSLHLRGIIACLA